MENTFEYVSINEVLSRILRHPLLLDVNIEAAILYVVDFLGITGIPDTYETREDIVDIDLYRGILPCELIEINMIKKIPEDIPLRAMTNVFNPVNKHHHHHHVVFDKMCHHDGFHHKDDEYTFKCQGKVIFTGFEKGKILVNYDTIKVDEDGFPMIINEPNFLKALELYIKQEVFGIKFDEGKITPLVLNNTQLQYAWAVGRFMSKWRIPSPSQMESIKSLWCSLIQRNNKFYTGFKSLGRPQIILNH